MKVLVLNEGSRQGEIGYHFTDYNGLKAIVNSNTMLSTNEPLIDQPYTRYKITFPDKTELSTDSVDKYKVEDYLKGFDSYYLRTIDNNLLKQKLQEYSQEELKKLKIEEYKYIPYKGLIGKKTWSYTRMPKGMAYRNFKTFGDNTVRIGIDIDKLTDKGYKVVPFSWTRQPKWSKYNEYEERVIGKVKGKDKDAVEGTFNFADFITEITVYTDRKIFIENFRYDDVIAWDKRIQEYQDKFNDPETYLDFNSIKNLKNLYDNLDQFLFRYSRDFYINSRPSTTYEMFSENKFNPYQNNQKYEEISAYTPIIEKLLALNPNIKVTYINSKTKKPKKTSEKTIAKFIDCLINFKKTKVGVSKEALTDSQFKDLLSYIQKVYDTTYKKIGLLREKIGERIEKLKNENKQESLNKIIEISNELKLDSNDFYLINLDYNLFYAVVASSAENAKAQARKLSEYPETVKLLKFSELNHKLDQLYKYRGKLYQDMNDKKRFRTQKEFKDTSRKCSKGISQLENMKKLLEIYGFDVYSGKSINSNLTKLTGSELIKNFKNYKLFTQSSKDYSIPIIVKNSKFTLEIKQIFTGEYYITLTRELTEKDYYWN